MESHSWEWWLEPILVPIGIILIKLMSWHEDMVWDWVLKHPTVTDLEINYKMFWGMKSLETMTLNDTARSIAVRKFIDNDHHSGKITYYYQTTYIISRVVNYYRTKR